MSTTNSSTVTKSASGGGLIKQIDDLISQYRDSIETAADEIKEEADKTYKDAINAARAKRGQMERAIRSEYKSNETAIIAENHLKHTLNTIKYEIAVGTSSDNPDEEDAKDKMFNHVISSLNDMRDAYRSARDDLKDNLIDSLDGIEPWTHIRLLQKMATSRGELLSEFERGLVETYAKLELEAKDTLGAHWVMFNLLVVQMYGYIDHERSHMNIPWQDGIEDIGRLSWDEFVWRLKYFIQDYANQYFR